MWLSLLLVFLPAILGLGMLGLINFVRRRWLWRHTGMVKPSNQIVPRWSVVFATIIYVLSIVFVFIYKPANTLLILQMLVVAAGWSTGLMLIGAGNYLKLVRYVWMGLLGGLISTLLLFTNLTFGQTALVFGLSWGIMFAVVGIAILWRFIFKREENING
jgi:hypothetical protein